jgi:hypothetical protein
MFSGQIQTYIDRIVADLIDLHLITSNDEMHAILYLIFSHYQDLRGESTAQYNNGSTN